ncbi:hypothetical protein NMG60_11005804 [Bertholletia excelsa]
MSEIENETLVRTITGEKNQPQPKEKESSMPQTKYLLFPVTIVTLLLSLPILSSVIWLLYMGQCDCEDLLKLQKLQLFIIIVLTIVFLSSNLVVYFKARFPVPGVLVIMVLLTVMFTMGLALVGAFNMESKIVPGSPMWLKMKVYKENTWNSIKHCIYDTRTCDDLVSRSYLLGAHDFSKTKLSPIESGCCIPPSSCNMEYINASFWIKEDDTDDRDCNLWKNEENRLCYYCNACKKGFLKAIQGEWWRLGTFLVVMALLLTVSHLLLFGLTILEQCKG